MSELQALAELRGVLARLRGLGAPSAPASQSRGSRPRPAKTGPLIQDVLSGLGYLAALQHSPNASWSQTMDPAVLQSLQEVVQQWLSERDPQPPEASPKAGGFYDQASEHLRLLGGGKQP